jgi:sigma-B regulation protein RsbU (phosphoserine phosphatase)
MSHPIILIDDSPVQLAFMTTLLEHHGFSVLPFAEQALAVESIKKLQPTLVLCDYVMPGRNGVEFCRELKTKGDFLDGFFLIITASVQPHEFVDDFHDLPDGWVAKSLPEEELIGTIKQWHELLP